MCLLLITITFLFFPLNPAMESLPPGFRFHPTDEELITYYLTRKVSDFCFVSTAIADVDLNKCEPWDLPAKSTMGEKEWYFFSLRDRKYPTGLRTNRATDAGYWKTTGKDKEIFHSGVLVGLKKTLVFYRGRAPKGEKSNWVMHEYRLESKFSFKPNKEEWVVCRVFQKSSTTKNKLQHTSSFHSSSSLDQPPCDTTTLNELGEIELPNSNSITNSSSGLSTFSNQSNNDSNINMNMSWASAARGATNNNLISASWPSSLLTSNTSMNSLLLRALQLGSYRQPRDNTSSDLNSMLTLGDYRFGTDINASLTTASSSNIVVDTTQQLPQFNQESMW